MNQKISLVFATATPGLQKLIIFSTAASFLNKIDFSRFAVEYSIVFLLSFICVVGWSGSILVNLSKSKSENEGGALFWSIFLSGAILLPIFIIIIYVLSYFQYINGWYEPALLLISLFSHQLARHYFLLKKKYDLINVVEVFAGFAFIGAMIITENPMLSATVCWLLSFLILLKNLPKFKFSFVDSVFYKESFNIGVSNFMIGGVVASMPIAASFLGQEIYSGVIAFSSVIINSVNILTRSMAYYYLPLMSGSSRDEAYLIFKKFFIVNLLVVLLLTVFLFVFYYISAEYFDIFSVEGSLYIYMAMILLFILSSICIPISNFFLAIKKSMVVSRSSFIYSILALLIFSLFYVFEESCIHCMVLLISIASLGRLFYFYNSIKIKQK